MPGTYQRALAPTEGLFSMPPAIFYNRFAVFRSMSNPLRFDTPERVRASFEVGFQPERNFHLPSQ